MEKVMESHGISRAEKSMNPVRCDTKGLSTVVCVYLKRVAFLWSYFDHRCF